MPFYHYSTGAQKWIEKCTGTNTQSEIPEIRAGELPFISVFFLRDVAFWHRGRSGPQTIPEIYVSRDVGILSGGLLFRPGTGRTLEEE